MMCHERCQIDATRRHHRHQPAHALLSTGTERCDDLLVGESRINRLVRRHEFAGVHTEARERAARSCGPQRVFEGLLTTERFDRDIRASAIGQPLDFSDHIAGVRIEGDVRAKTSRGCEALLVAVDADDQRGAA